MSYFDKSSVGRLVTRAVNDMETIASIFSQGLFMIVADLMQMLIVIIVMLALTILLWLYGYQTFTTVLYNCLLGVSLLFFFKAIEKTFLLKHCYLVLVSIAICIIPTNFGYYTLTGIAYFWAIAVSYPLGHLIKLMNRVYFSSLRSKIS